MFRLNLQTVFVCGALFPYLEARAEVCNNAACKDLANTLHRKMDPSVDPCEDFYQFSCGGFIKNTKIPEHEGMWSIISEIDKVIDATLLEDLESKSLQGMPCIYQKAKDFYRSCMDTAAIEKRGVNDIKQMLKSYGGWPVLEKDWKEDTFDWIAVTKTLSEAGQTTNMILPFGVGSNEKNVVQSVISVSQPNFGGDISIDRFYLVNGTDDPVVKVYFQLMVNLAIECGADPTEATRQLQEVLQFETELVNVTELNEDLRDHSTVLQTITISEMQKKYPEVNWLYFFTTVFRKDAKVTKDDLVQIYSPVYIKKLGALLKKTKKRVLANYIMWQVVYSSKRYLTKRIEDMTQKLYEARFGLKSKTPRKEFCVAKSKERMTGLIAVAYVKKHFDSKSKKIATDVIELIRKKFLDVIAKVDFLDQETREKALDKIENTKLFVGYPDEFMDDKLLVKYFQKLVVDKSDFYRNVLNSNIFDTYTNLKWLHKPYNASSWEVQGFDCIISSNAYYSPVANAIAIYAGMMQGYFFNPNLPFYLNVATLGPTTVGHELTHAVDDQGGEYDKCGNLRNWWGKSTKEKFKKEAQEIIDVYSTYVVKEVNLKLNADNMVGEIIADQGGYKLAYMAFEEAISDLKSGQTKKGQKAQDPGLVGFEKYTPKQLYWIIAAVGWCTKYRPEVLRRQVESNVHPPEEFRVNGPFMNSDLFSESWKCPEGSKMNPKKKVNIW